jgi:hypothetical protein
MNLFSARISIAFSIYRTERIFGKSKLSAVKTALLGVFK